MRAILSDDDDPRLVREFFGGAKGYFVDVGANDPKAWSQTWHLEQAGWSGVLVEPIPELAEKLRQERTAKVFAFACSAPANSGTTMTINLAGVHSSLNPDHFVFGMRREGIIEVPVKTLDEILTDAMAPVPLDFVSIDVESHEIDVLEGFNLKRWRPRLMLVEDLVQDLKLHRYLRARGYKWLRRTGLNGWYVPVETPMRVGWFGRLQFLRKYYLGVPFRRGRDMLRRLRTRLNWFGPPR